MTAMTSLFDDSYGSEHVTPDGVITSDDKERQSRSITILPEGDVDSEDGLPSLEALAERIHSRFSASNRDRIQKELISEILQGLDLSVPVTRVAPRLLINRLIFAGEKTLHGAESPVPFRYDQTFAAGVNVLLIPDNNVGKSSIAKTIKFALTGDDGDYDSDVRGWIQQVWLQFALGGNAYTIYLSRSAGLRGILVAHAEDRRLEELPEVPAIFDVSGGDKVRERLQQFFFDQLSIGELSWTAKDQSATRGVGQRTASWKVFFQALNITHDSDEYLLCDKEHNYGNQEGIILSVFLGLRLVEPLNELGVERALTKKQEHIDKQKVEEAKQEAERLKAELSSLQKQIADQRAEKSARLKAFQSEVPTQRLSEISTLLRANLAEREQTETLRDNLSKRIKNLYASARRIKEAIDYKLHFTGLSVSLCPNCEAEVEDDAVTREMESHSCRLCGKQPKTASPEDLDSLRAKAAELDNAAKKDAVTRTALNKQLEDLRKRQRELEKEAAVLKSVMERAIDVSTATEQEETAMAALYERAGGLKARITVAEQRANIEQSTTEDTDLRLRVVQKAREILEEEAGRLNRSVLERLSMRTQEVTSLIGVDSITDITCSPVGWVKLKKHNVEGRFPSFIKNPGERTRVKLAFFLSMMRIGREPGMGRHPGLLLVDQPGSAEMVPDDRRSLAEVFRRLDTELSDEVQIICFTAEPEFNASTTPEKVYGPGPDGRAF